IKKLNDNFVWIKVGREEHPEIEARYLEAVRAARGLTGMPMMVILTPDGKFLAGGAFSDFDDDHVHSRPGVLTTLSYVTGLWSDQREQTQKLADSVDDKISKLPPIWQKPAEPPKKIDVPNTPKPEPKTEPKA